MHRDISQEQFYAGIWRKNAAPQDRDNRFLRACAVEIHMDISQKQFLWENVPEKCGAPRSRKTCAADFVRAYAVEMQLDISQEPFYAEIYR